MPFTPALSGTDFGFDFNPTVDRIRIVSDAERNLLSPAGSVVAAAYINNYATPTTTTLFDIDSVASNLVVQSRVREVPTGTGMCPSPFAYS